MQAFLIISLHHSTHFYYFPSLFLLSALTEVQCREGKYCMGIIGFIHLSPSQPLSHILLSISLQFFLSKTCFPSVCVYLNIPFTFILLHSSATYQLFCLVSLYNSLFLQLCDVLTHLQLQFNQPQAYSNR